MNIDRRKKTIIVTDLDHSDDGGRQKVVERKSKPALKTISGNFNRRSHSADCKITRNKDSKENSHVNWKYGREKMEGEGFLHQLLHSKDKQMEELLKRLRTLHKYNDQFADENKRLHNDVEILSNNLVVMRQQLAQKNECEKCIQLHAQMVNTIEINRTLENDISMMKTLVYRLNVQIDRYQEKLRNIPESPTTKGEQRSDDNVLSPQSQPPHHRWGGPPIHTQTLGPLLQSYDEMIKYKDDLIVQYKNEFETFTSELKQIVEENSRLHQDSEMAKRDMSNWREERTRLQAQLDVCRSKADVQTRKADLAKEKLVEVMQCYEQKTQGLVLDLEQLQSAYARCKNELASVKNNTNIILHPNQQSTIIVQQSLEKCKELLDQLKCQHRDEKCQMESTIKELKELNATSENRLATIKSDNCEMKRQLESRTEKMDEMHRQIASLQRIVEKIKKSRDRLKARLRIALQWAQKLEEGQANIQNTWDALKRLEQIVKHKESQVRGLHARHIEEIKKFERKLLQKDETIRTILKGKATPAAI